MAPNPRPTLQTIADHCGVTKTTVSLALRNHPRITEATRKRVLAAAKALDYRTNPLVAAHMSMVRSTKAPRYQATIGVVTDWPLKTLLEPGSVWGRHIDGIKARADELGFLIDCFSLAESGMTIKRILQILLNRGIQGVIVPPIVSDEGTLDLDWDQISAVAIGYSMRSPLIHRACHDNYSTIRNTVKFLDRQGFRRIGIAVDKRSDTRVKNLWSGGYLSKVMHGTSKLPLLQLVTNDWSKTRFGEWLEKEKPDVVITTTSEAVAWSRELGYDVPEDLSIVTLTSLDEEVSGYDQVFERVGAAAVEKVISLLHQNERGIPSNPQTILTQGRWVKGKTLKLKNPNDEPTHFIY